MTAPVAVPSEWLRRQAVEAAALLEDLCALLAAGLRDYAQLQALVGDATDGAIVEAVRRHRLAVTALEAMVLRAERHHAAMKAAHENAAVEAVTVN